MTRRKKFKRELSFRQLINFDWLLVGVVLGLTLLGLVMIFDASVAEAYHQFGDKYYFVKLQLFWSGLGLLSLIFFAFIPFEWLKKLSRVIFIVSIIALVAVLIPGIGAKVQGARRWISLGSFRLQPSELVKFAAVLYLPSWLQKKSDSNAYLFLVGAILILLMLQPDMGTSLIITGVAFSLYFLSGAPLRSFLKLLMLMLTAGVLLIATSSYRMDRVRTFFDPGDDPLGNSYHIRQVMISLGSGGLTGTGIGRSRQKFQYLPEASTDSIFAVIGEETGFIGAGLVVIAFVVFIVKAGMIAGKTPDPYMQLVSAGVLSWIGLQALLNLGAMVALVPLTGIPLPFVSYGGSALVTAMSGAGLLINASRFKDKKHEVRGKRYEL